MENVYQQCAEKVWNSYKIFVDTAYVSRSGFGLYGLTEIHDTDINQNRHVAKSFYRRGESALEHQAKMAMLCNLFASNFPCYFGRISYSAQECPFIWFLTMVSLSHDIGETEIGDIPDDGNPAHALKDEAEFEVFKKFANLGFNKKDAELMIARFRDFQGHQGTIGKAIYALDKLDAVLTLIYLEKHGIRSRNKTGAEATPLDRHYMKIAGSTSATDCWAVHLKAHIGDFPLSIVEPVFTVLEVAITDARGKMFDWWEKDIPDLVE